MKRIILLLLSMYIFGCSSSLYKTEIQTKEFKFETPAAVIETYYTALKNGDQELLEKCFIGKKNLKLAGEIKNIQYKIKGVRVISKEEAAARSSGSTLNILEEGDVEVFLNEILGNNTEEMTFILRKVNKEWRIYSHSLGYYV